MPLTFPVRLDVPVQHVDIQPGGEIVLRGSFRSTHDGSTLDAATTTWPAEAPGGASVDSGGLVDFEAGGFHMTSRDPATHEVHAVATGEGGPACAAAGVAAPCLPLRVLPQARTRLLTMDQWTSSLKGGITAEVIAPPAYAPAADAASSAAPYLGVAAGVLATAGVLLLTMRARRRRAASPAGQLALLAARVQAKLRDAEAVAAAPLQPAVARAIERLRERRVDAGSSEGRRVRVLLERVEASIDARREKARAEEEQAAADELVRDIESALEAADEALQLERR